MSKPVLYLLLGYPGSGKTTTSLIISKLTGAEHIWADHERKSMFKQPTHSHSENLELYKELNRKAADLLSEGKSVVFDTNFNFYKDRVKLSKIAHERGAVAKLIWVVTPKAIARDRAIKDADSQDTRVLGDMPEHQFDRITRNLQEPRSNEPFIQVDGTKVDENHIRNLLQEHNLLP